MKKQRERLRHLRLATAAGIGGAGALAATVIAWAVFGRPPDAILPLRPEALDSRVAALIRDHVTNVRADPFAANRHGRLGLVYEANALWREATAAFDRAAALEPSDPVWPYHAAVACHLSGQYESALGRLREVTATFRDFAPAHHRYGVLLLRAGEFDSAEEAFRRTTTLAPARPEGYVGLGRVALEKTDYVRAVDVLQKALTLDADYRMAHFLLGSAYRGLGRWDDAKRHWARGADAPARYLPDRWSGEKEQLVAGVSYPLRRGANLIRAGKPAAAIKALEPALEARPNDVNVMNNLAIAYQRTGQHSRALDLLMRAREVDGDMFGTSINLADCLLEMGRAQEALRFAERAVALAPKASQAHFARGHALVALGQAQEAYPSLKTALRLDPRNLEALMVLAEVCMQLSWFDEARTHLEEATKQLPESVPCHVNLCVVCLQLRDLPAARRALGVAQRLAPDDPRVVSLTQRLGTP